MNTAAVATHHPIAARAAREMLLAGGNATDAAVAAMAALCVVVPGSVGIGGYGGTMIHVDGASGRASCVEFNTRAPLEFRGELYADHPKCKSTIGYLATSVPGVVSGLATALSRFGTKSWKDATHFAIELAEEGFEVDAHHRTVLEMWHKTADELSRRSHFADGDIPNVGNRWVQKDLAKLLRALAADGPESFYRGEIADRICRQIRSHGGIISCEDFATYEPLITEPLAIDYRGHTILTPPPTAGGITMLQMLRTLEHFDVAAIEPWSAAYLHLVAEVTKKVWPDRQLLGDPDFVAIPYEKLLATSLASSRAADIRRHDIKTGVEMQINDAPHTCNVSIADRFGNVVSMTATQGAQFGSGVVIEGLGLVLGHGMSRFEYTKPHHPNAPAPGKRPQHNMSPAIVLKDGEPVAAMGMPGGTRIPTVTAQLIVSLIDFDATPEQAVHATRVHYEGTGQMIVSQTTPKLVARELEAMGYKLQFGEHALGTPIMLGGPAGIVQVDGDEMFAASNASPDAACVL